jgi:hypothetical protein
VLNGTPVVVDRRYVLAAVGLLAAEHPDTAVALAAALLGSADTITAPAG